MSTRDKVSKKEAVDFLRSFFAEFDCDEPELGREFMAKFGFSLPKLEVFGSSKEMALLKSSDADAIKLIFNEFVE